jgi:hypothetical protein
MIGSSRSAKFALRHPASPSGPPPRADLRLLSSRPQIRATRRLLSLGWNMDAKYHSFACLLQSGTISVRTLQLRDHIGAIIRNNMFDRRLVYRPASAQKTRKHGHTKVTAVTKARTPRAVVMCIDRAEARQSSCLNARAADGDSRWSLERSRVK